MSRLKDDLLHGHKNNPTYKSNPREYLRRRRHQWLEVLEDVELLTEKLSDDEFTRLFAFTFGAKRWSEIIKKIDARLEINHAERLAELQHERVRVRMQTLEKKNLDLKLKNMYVCPDHFRDRVGNLAHLAITDSKLWAWRYPNPPQRCSIKGCDKQAKWYYTIEELSVRPNTPQK